MCTSWLHVSWYACYHAHQHDTWVEKRATGSSWLTNATQPSKHHTAHSMGLVVLIGTVDIVYQIHTV